MAVGCNETSARAFWAWGANRAGKVLLSEGLSRCTVRPKYRLNQAAQERVDVCQNPAAARAHHPPTPDGMSGSDNSIAENLPPNPGRGRSIAPFRIDASRDQNSAGKYPLISRPTQISTRVGVIHDMAFFLLGCGDNTPFLNAPPPSAVKQHFA